MVKQGVYPWERKDEVREILNWGGWKHMWHYPDKDEGLTSCKNATYAYKIIVKARDAALRHLMRCQSLLDDVDWASEMDDVDDGIVLDEPPSAG